MNNLHDNKKVTELEITLKICRVAIQNLTVENFNYISMFLILFKKWILLSEIFFFSIYCARFAETDISYTSNFGATPKYLKYLQYT